MDIKKRTIEQIIIHFKDSKTWDIELYFIRHWDINNKMELTKIDSFINIELFQRKVIYLYCVKIFHI